MSNAQAVLRLDGVVIGPATLEVVPARPATDTQPAREEMRFQQIQVACSESLFDGQLTDVTSAIVAVRTSVIGDLDGFGAGQVVTLQVHPYATYTPKVNNRQSYNVVGYRFVAEVKESVKSPALAGQPTTTAAR